jgi:RNA polymerase sigma factor (sigma-70 family)
MVQFLQYGPRIQINDEDHFRALLVRIVENGLRDKNDWFKARRRAISQECPLPSDTILCLDNPRQRVKTPSAAAQDSEREAWVRLGMELLEPEEREVLVFRQWENLSFAKIGERLGITADAARMRNNRAISRLGEIVGELRRGNFSGFAKESGS